MGWLDCKTSTQSIKSITIWWTLVWLGILHNVYNWDGLNCWLYFGDFDPVFKVTGELALVKKEAFQHSITWPSAWIQVKRPEDLCQTCTDISLEHVFDLIRFWWPWLCFQRWHVTLNVGDGGWGTSFYSKNTLLVMLILLHFLPIWVQWKVYPYLSTCYSPLPSSPPPPPPPPFSHFVQTHTCNRTGLLLAMSDLLSGCHNHATISW